MENPPVNEPGPIEKLAASCKPIDPLEFAQWIEWNIRNCNSNISAIQSRKITFNRDQADLAKYIIIRETLLQTARQFLKEDTTKIVLTDEQVEKSDTE